MSNPARELAAKASTQHAHHLDHALRTLKEVHEATGQSWGDVSLRSQHIAPWPILVCDDICVRGVAIWRVETAWSDDGKAIETRVRDLT